ncbi:MAG TPA: exopolysaccharide biosynthesis protein [Candidatus Obscuribacterales bacterium]
MRFSQDVKSLLQSLAERPLTLGDVLATTSERGFSLAIGLLVLPFLFPMPPGATGIFGSGCFLLAVQMAMGRRSPWLPRRVARFKFPRWLILKLLKNLQRITGVVERFARRRLVNIADSPNFWRLNGVCIAWLSVVLILPIPFTNPIPTVGILLFVIATLESDGLLMCISYGVTAFITLLVAVVAYLLWQAPGLLQNL